MGCLVQTPLKFTSKHGHKLLLGKQNKIIYSYNKIYDMNIFLNLFL